MLIWLIAGLIWAFFLQKNKAIISTLMAINFFKENRNKKDETI